MIQTLKQSLVKAVENREQALEAYEAKERKYQEELSRVQRKLARYQAKRGELIPTFNWIETFVHPLAQAIQQELGLASYEAYGPFGLRSEVSIFWHSSEDDLDKPTYSLRLTPYNLATGVIHFDTGEVSEHYDPNTIGALNGLGNQTAPLPDSLDELIHQLKSMASREA